MRVGGVRGGGGEERGGEGWGGGGGGGGGEGGGGVFAASHAQVAVAVSGTAGPAGGTPEKPVGTVCLAWALRNGEPVAETRHFAGDREAVRRQTVVRALEGVLKLFVKGEG